MDISKIREIMPRCRLSEIRPCATPGSLQFHLLVDADWNPAERLINLRKLSGMMPPVFETRFSDELGVIKAKHRDAEISILASGRIVVKKARSEDKARELLELLVPPVAASLFSPKHQ